MDAEFILTKLALEEIRKLGYTEVWLGAVPNPHWEHGLSTGIIAAPKQVDFSGWPNIWRVSEELFGQNSSGNGLRHADNAFRSVVGRMIPGHYVLVEGSWNPTGSFRGC